MRRNMHISKVGLKLIKAYEGYRPVDRHLVNGQHVVGYGHIIEGTDSLVLTRPEAEALLLRDLEPYEDMINETVHAPLSQSQFDALVSLAFNIGPRAFTESDTLRALNNGRPLDAASGFDIWRKSTIDGKTYVVDALMRRRAAEKALFLRTEGKKTLPASRADLPPVKDDMVALLSTEDALPMISSDLRNGIVARVPYDAGTIDETALEIPDEDSAFDTAKIDEMQSGAEDKAVYVPLTSDKVELTQKDTVITQKDPASQFIRRREDGPSGILELSEVYEEEEEAGQDSNILQADNAYVDAAYLDDDLVDRTYEVDEFEDESISEPLTDALPVTEGSSRIADTASKISGRLDALIDDVANDDGTNGAGNWPESLIQSTTALENQVSSDKKSADIVIDNLAADDAFRERTDSAAKYIKMEPPIASEAPKRSLGYFIPLFIGMSLLGASAGAFLGNPTAILGEWGPLLSFIGLVVGAIMTIFTLYYVVKTRR